jgi:hypothetical protein
MHQRQLAVFLPSHLNADHLHLLQRRLTDIDSSTLFTRVRFDYGKGFWRLAVNSAISTGQGVILIVEQPVFAVRITERNQ